MVRLSTLVRQNAGLTVQMAMAIEDLIADGYAASVIASLYGDALAGMEDVSQVFPAWVTQSAGGRGTASIKHLARNLDDLQGLQDLFADQLLANANER